MTQRQFSELVRVALTKAGTFGDRRVTRDQARETVAIVTDALVTALRLEGDVKLDSLGWFNTRGVAEKSGVSKMGGVAKEWTVPQHTTVKFKPSPNLMSAINTWDETTQDDPFLKSKGLELYDADRDNEFYEEQKTDESSDDTDQETEQPDGGTDGDE